MNPLKKLTAVFSRTSLNLHFPYFLTAIRRSSEASEVSRKFWKKRGYNNVLIITDTGIRSLGLTERLEQTLKRNCISYQIYDKTVANPTTVNVDEALHMYLDNDCQAIIGFGGGSSMDCAKSHSSPRIAKPTSLWHR